MKSFIRRYIIWNWNWNLDSALRYDKAVTLIHKLKPETLVEVGSGERGISAYAGYPSFGVDITFDESVKPGMQRRILASGTKLPFDDATADFVIATDMLEHVSADMRPLVIKEMFRIVKQNGVVYIAVPAGRHAADADFRIYNAYKAKRGKAHPMLRDHLHNGLPNSEDVIDLVDRYAKKNGWKVTSFWNTPVSLWEWNLMWFGVERWVPGLRHFQRIILQPFYPLLKMIKSSMNYRVVIIASGRELPHDQ